MSRMSVIGLPASLMVAGAAVALVLVHFIVSLVRLGVGPNLAAGLSTGSHGYWPAFAIATTLIAAGAAIQARHRLERAPRRPSGDAALGRRAVGVWLTLLAVCVVGFMTMENAEALLSSGRLVGIAPLSWMAQPLAVLGVAAGLAVVAAGIVLVVNVRTETYSATLVSSYRDLVETGTYSSTFAQSDWARGFVADVLEVPLARFTPGSLSVLECGSGTGIWLAYVSDLIAGRDARIHGFDLSPEMVEVARQRLAGQAVTADIEVGDILDPGAYEFGGVARHDVVYAFDVIQQLPAKLQGRAVAAMFDHVAPAGWLVVFDNDRHSKYGRVMGLKKWLRRYFDIPLVPRFYIHARYPNLRALRPVVEGMGGTDISIVVERLGRKRALIARRPVRPR